MEIVRSHLLSQADPQYRAFTLPLIPNVDPATFIGVRLPVLKKYAKDMDAGTREAFLEELPHRYHEENILHAFALSNIKDYDEFVAKADAFLPYVSNWSVCDTICNKHIAKHKERLIHDVKRWIASNQPYTVRYGIKCLMNYYLGEDFDEDYIRLAQSVHLDDYYVKMMVAWYLATGLAKNYESFVKPLECGVFDGFTHNKAIQKACESYRVSDDHKAYLKTLKR